MVLPYFSSLKVIWPYMAEHFQVEREEGLVQGQLAERFFRLYVSRVSSVQVVRWSPERIQLGPEGARLGSIGEKIWKT